MILALNTDGYKYIAQDLSEIYLKIQSAVKVFDTLRGDVQDKNNDSVVTSERGEEVEMSIQGNNRVDQRERLLDNST